MNIIQINNYTYSPNSKTDKTKISKQESYKPEMYNKNIPFGKSLGIALGALIVGGLLYKNVPINSNSKKEVEIDAEVINSFNQKSISKISEIQNKLRHIDYVEAQTFDEAVKFGFEKLGIKKYRDFKERDLGVINWVNEGLVNVYNKSKGNAHLPLMIEYKSLGIDEDGIVTARLNTFRKSMTINKDFVRELKDYVANREKNARSSVRSLPNHLIIGDYKKEETTIKYHFDYIPHSCRSRFSTIYHEMGHLQHLYNIGYDSYSALSKSNNSRNGINEKAEMLRQLFESKKDLAKGISDYATTSPCEFVAEVYSKLCDGYKVPKETLDLYQKLGGVLI